MTDGPEDPNELEPLADYVARRKREIAELAALRVKHANRKAVTEPHPIFPTEPDAA